MTNLIGLDWTNESRLLFQRVYLYRLFDYGLYNDSDILHFECTGPLAIGVLGFATLIAMLFGIPSLDGRGFL